MLRWVVHQNTTADCADAVSVRSRHDVASECFGSAFVSQLDHLCRIQHGTWECRIAQSGVQSTAKWRLQLYFSCAKAFMKPSDVRTRSTSDPVVTTYSFSRTLRFRVSMFWRYWGRVMGIILSYCQYQRVWTCALNEAAMVRNYIEFEGSKWCVSYSCMNSSIVNLVKVVKVFYCSDIQLHILF